MPGCAHVYCGVPHKRVDELADSRIPEIAARRRGVSAEELRRHNLAAVLDFLHITGATSRSELAGHTGLNRSTIRDLVGELGSLGLVAEDRGTAPRGPGRPSSVATPRPEGAVVLAAELEVDSMAVATVGLGGHIFDEARIPMPRESRSPSRVVSGLADLGRPLVASLPAGHRLVGVGVGVAGVVRRQDGFVHVSPNLGWSNVPLRGMIAEELSVDRVMMANEADLGALAEHRRGAGRSQRHLIYVAGEVGVGIGVIYDGRPMLGAAGYAGEAGHNMVNPTGRACRCGSVGCWETEVGEEALARRAGISEGDAREGLVDEIVRRAQAGEARTIDALGEIGRWLGIGIGNLINTFNPEVVVIGGFFDRLYPWLEPAMHAWAQRMALSAPWMTCSIRRSELGADAVLIGAAELVFAEVIANPSALPAPVAGLVGRSAN